MSVSSDQYRTRIVNAARAGTPVNPIGVPLVLAQLIAAQAAHETGDFKSNAFTRYNNAFGYSYSGSRYQAGPGLTADNGQPIAAYTNLEDSVREIVDWIYRRRAAGVFPKDLTLINSPEIYAGLLKQAGYYQDTLTNYLNGLKHFFLPAAAVGAGLAWVVAGVFAYINRKSLVKYFR